MPTISSIVNYFPSAVEGFTTTLNGTIASGAATVVLNSIAGYTNGDTVVLIIDPTDNVKKQAFTGIVDTSGVRITSVVWTEGTNQTHTTGATIVDYWTATHMAMVTKGILVDHSQAGAHEIATNFDPANPTLETQKWVGVASAVNEITFTNAATTAAPFASATGGDTNIGLDLSTKGTGAMTLWSGTKGRELLILPDVASAVNEVTISSAITGTTGPLIAPSGETNIDLRLAAKGTGAIHNTYGTYGDITSDSDGATVTFNLATSNIHKVTLGGNRTMALSNEHVGQCFILRLLQDGTGSRTVTWFTTIKWAGGVAPTLTTTASKADVLGFIVTGAGTYDGFVVGANL